MLWISLLMSMTLGVFGLPPDLESCPKMTLMENFNLQKFLGKWYEAERYYSVLYTGVKCSTVNYTKMENGTVHLIETTYSTRPEANSSVIRQQEVINMTNEPIYRITGEYRSGLYSSPLVYEILGTDYDNYSVIWHCLDVGLIRMYSARIFTRQKHAEPDVLENAYKFLENNKINRTQLQPTDKKNCPEDY